MSKRLKLKIVFIGSKQAGAIGALTVLAAGVKILAAVSYCKDLNNILKLLKIPIHKSVKDKKLIKTIKRSDLILCVHGREIVESELLALPKFKSINIHPYLYKYKGSNPVGRALKDEEFCASVGAHIMEKEVDSGKVLVEEFVDVNGIHSVEGIYNKLYPYYSKVILKVLDMASRKYK